MYDFYNEYNILAEIIEERKEKQRPTVERLNNSGEKKYNEFVKKLHSTLYKGKKMKNK